MEFAAKTRLFMTIKIPLTPKEKAKELVQKFNSKPYALIAVDEILELCNDLYDSNGNNEAVFDIKADIEFYQQVKEEINLL